MSKRVEAVVRRESNKETTIALVSCEESAEVRNPMELKAAIKNAVTDWMLHTDDGLKELIEADEDFNIGDLANAEYDGPPLRDCLRQHGICDLKIDIHTLQVNVDHFWTFDSLLMDRVALFQAGRAKKGL